MPRPLRPAALQQRIDAVDWDIAEPVRQWNTSDAPALDWTYRFESAEAPDFPWDDVSGLAAYTAAQRDTVREALSQFERYINIEFREITNQAADPVLSFYRASEGLFGGRGRFQYFYNTDGGQVTYQDWDGAAVFNTDRSLGSGDMSLVLHEIAHTLGMKHTGNYDVGGNLPPGPFLSEAEDNRRYSILSYNNDPQTGRDIPALGIYDVAALQARFGANLSHNTGKTSYTGPENGLLEVIWDAGGIDRINARGLADDVFIDLRAGMFSDLGGRGDLVIAYGAEIENARGGGGDDDLRGNGGDNRLSGGHGLDRLVGGGGEDRLTGNGGDDFLFGGGGSDRLSGGAGDDLLEGGAGSDRFLPGPGEDDIRGGGGRDFLVLNGNRADFDLSDRGNGTWTIARPGGEVDQFRGIERLVFDDMTLTV